MSEADFERLREYVRGVQAVEEAREKSVEQLLRHNIELMGKAARAAARCPDTIL
jgi:hypothetical protein